MFGKIFVQMYEGTLASRGPWQALVTFQQLIVLANRHGEVDMTPEAVSARTTIPLEIIKIGLAALEKDDPDSRTPAENGRRIVLLNTHRSWGWRIVNYDHYRKMRSEDERREYMRNLMAEKRAKLKAEKSADVSDVSSALALVSNVSPCSKQYAVSNKPHSSETEVSDSTDGKPLPPKPRKPRKPTPEPEGFAEFWERYPKKKAKQAAVRAWRKITSVELQTILAALDAVKKTHDWQKDGGQFIPHPATWLNERRWEDEITLPVRNIRTTPQPGLMPQRKPMEVLRAEA